MLVKCCDRCGEKIETAAADNIFMKNLAFSKPAETLPSSFLFTPRTYDLCPKCMDAFKYEFMGMPRQKPERKRNNKTNKE